MIIETNVSEYALVAILLIMMEGKKIHSVAFYSHKFKATKLNYNIYDK